MPTSDQRPGRPVGPRGRGRRVQVYLPVSVLDDLDAEAARREVSRSTLLVDAVEALLRRGRG